jgi:hypothetical protein
LGSDPVKIADDRGLDSRLQRADKRRKPGLEQLGLNFCERDEIDSQRAHSAGHVAVKPPDQKLDTVVVESWKQLTLCAPCKLTSSKRCRLLGTQAKEPLRENRLFFDTRAAGLVVSPIDGVVYTIAQRRLHGAGLFRLPPARFLRSR